MAKRHQRQNFKMVLFEVIIWGSKFLSNKTPPNISGENYKKFIFWTSHRFKFGNVFIAIICNVEIPKTRKQVIQKLGKKLFLLYCTFFSDQISQIQVFYLKISMRVISFVECSKMEGCKIKKYIETKKKKKKCFLWQFGKLTV